MPKSQLHPSTSFDKCHVPEIPYESSKHIHPLRTLRSPLCPPPLPHQSLALTPSKPFSALFLNLRTFACCTTACTRSRSFFTLLYIHLLSLNTMFCRHTRNEFSNSRHHRQRQSHGERDTAVSLSLPVNPSVLCFHFTGPRRRWPSPRYLPSLTCQG